MNVTLQAICMIATIALLLAFVHVPLGTWMYRCFTDENDWAPERLIYRAVGVDPRVEQGWRTYAVASVMFGVASVVLLFALIMAQGVLPWGLGAARTGTRPSTRPCRSRRTRTGRATAVSRAPGTPSRWPA